ncbi:MAG: cytochrome P450 [Candidatus Xenobia bacterium]
MATQAPVLPSPPLIGHMPRFLRDSLSVLEEVAKVGDVVRFHLGMRVLHLINDPELIKLVLVTRSKQVRKTPVLRRMKILLGEGLLTSDGEFHLRQRRLVQPAFHRTRLDGYARDMVALTERRIEQWADGSTLQVDEEMMRITLTIVGKTLFAADVDNEASEIGQAMTQVLHAFKLMLMPFHDLARRLPLPANRRFLAARARLDSTIFRLIQAHRNGPDRGDLLSMLMMARDEEGDGAGMTDRQVRDEAMTLFLAGHETTANLLTWTLYLLSQHPEVEALLLEELRETLAGRAPAFSDLPRLTRLNQVVAESMRLYPPAWIISREVVEPFDVGGYRMAPGRVLMMSPWVTHRDARWYPEPQQFRPGRWTPEFREKLPRFAYFPFGGGPRLCIGEQFAWTEAQLVLATILPHWRFTLAKDAVVTPLPVVTLRTRYGLPMQITRRAS